MSALDTARLSVLTVGEIMSLLRGRLPVPRMVKQRRDTLINFLIERADPAIVVIFQEAIETKITQQEQASIGKKRKRADDQRARRSARRMEDDVEALRDPSLFLQLPIPKNPHPQHDLFDGKLLQPEGVVDGQSEAGTLVRVCHNCLADLTTAASKAGEKPPRFSLANNLWIGRVPWQLQTLAFPEQMLIALLYPCVFVFKLYPKDLNYCPDAPSLQRGLHGNVSTYDLDMEGATSMVQGWLMPRPVAVLPTVISITFIGRGQLSKRSLSPIFRVRCQFVAEALRWLKNYNPKYYSHIKIDPDRLRLLPQDDVPDELIGVVRQSTDTGIVDQESAGYVPTEHANDTALPEKPQSDVVDQPKEVCEGGSEASQLPEVIPLQFSSTVDSDLSKLTANEMMAWGLSNLWNQGCEGGYLSDFGLPRNGPTQAHSVPDTHQSNFFEKAFPCLFPYGHGGIEAEQEVQLHFREHVAWALKHYDRRFCKHETFPFLAFGILQRREALGSARVQMGRQNFECEAKLMSTVSLDRLEQARSEEEKGIPISDPTVQLLRHHVNATIGRIMASE
ncbi:hypothetical protein JOM56_012204 [Amanita muscaria]